MTYGTLNPFYSRSLATPPYPYVYDYKTRTENSELFGVMNIQPRSLSKTSSFYFASK